MADLSKKILAEKENVEIALNNLKTVISREEKTVIELAAIATFLHNVYNGIENIIKQCLKGKDISIPKSRNWHKELLNLSVSNNILSQRIVDKLFEYLSFRHFFIHAYGSRLEIGLLEELTKNIPTIWIEFMKEIDNLI